jgi:hypothetical protein
MGRAQTFPRLWRGKADKQGPFEADGNQSLVAISVSAAMISASISREPLRGSARDREHSSAQGPKDAGPLALAASSTEDRRTRFLVSASQSRAPLGRRSDGRLAASPDGKLTKVLALRNVVSVLAAKAPPAGGSGSPPASLECDV